MVGGETNGVCGWPAGGGGRERHDLHLGGGQTGDDREGFDVLHYDYCFV